MSAVEVERPRSKRRFEGSVILIPVAFIRRSFIDALTKLIVRQDRKPFREPPLSGHLTAWKLELPPGSTMLV